MWRYWFGSDISNGTNSENTYVVDVPNGCEQFSGEVEMWLQDQCASLGVGTSIKIRSSKQLKRQLSATSARKSLKDDDGKPSETQPQKSIESDVSNAPQPTTPRKQTTTRSDTIKMKVRIDKKLVKMIDEQYADLRTGVASQGGATGTIGERLPIVAECGSLQRFQHCYGKCLYKVAMSRYDIMVPPACLRHQLNSNSENSPPCGLCDVISSNAAAPSAVAVAASKIKIFDIPVSEFNHLPDQLSDTNLRLISCAVQEMYPDTALFYKRRRLKKSTPSITFCACGIGSRYIEGWLPTVAIFQKQLPQRGVSLVNIGAKNGCGIYYQNPENETTKKPLWQYRERSGSWVSFTPSDSHIIENISRHRGEHTTPLTFTVGCYYSINTCKKTMRKIGNVPGMCQLFEIRRTHPEILVSDIRIGDVVRMRQQNFCGEVMSIDAATKTCRIAIGGNDVFTETLPWEGLEVVDLRTYQIGPLESTALSSKVALFGPPTAVATTLSNFETLTGLRRVSIPIHPAVAKKCAQQLSQLQSPLKDPLQIDIFEDHVVVATSDLKEPELLRSLSRYCLGSWIRNYQSHNLEKTFAAIRRKLSTVKRSFTKHEGFLLAENDEQIFNSLPSRNKTPSIRNLISNMGSSDEETLRQISLMWTTLDDFSDGLKREYNNVLCICDDEWNLSEAMLGVRSGHNVTVYPDYEPDRGIKIGDKVCLRPSAQKTTFRYSSIPKGSIGVVLGSQMGKCNVAFEGYSTWKGSHSFLELVEIPVEGMLSNAAVCLQDESLDGVNPGIVSFSNSIRKWVSSVVSGTDDPGCPSCVSAEVHFGDNRQTTRLLCPTSKILQPSCNASNSENSPEGINGRIFDVIFNLIGLKWNSLAEAMLVQSLVTVIKESEDLDASTMAEVKVTHLIKNCLERTAALRKDLDAVCAEWRSSLQGSLVKKQMVSFLDLDDDEEKAFTVKDGKLHFENDRVVQLDFDSDSCSLIVLAPDAKTEHNICINLDIIQIRELSTICANTSTKAPFLDRFSSLNIDHLFATLDRHILCLSHEWRDALTSHLFDIRKTRQALKSAKLRNDTPRRCDIFNFKSQIRNAHPMVSIDWDECTVEGLPGEVADALKTINRRISSFGSDNSLVCEIPASVSDIISKDSGMVSAAVAAATGLSKLKLVSSREQNSEIKLVGSRGELTSAMQILGISYESDTVFRSGPDVRPRPDPIPIRCCGVQTSPVMELSCGHCIHKECISTLKGLRCPICYQLIRLPEIQKFGCDNLLQQLHLQCEAAFEQSDKLTKCECGSWVFNPPGSLESALCSNCDRVVKVSGRPISLCQSPLPLCQHCNEPVVSGFQCNLCVSFVTCRKCTHKHKCVASQAVSLREVEFGNDPADSNHLAHSCQYCKSCTSFAEGDSGPDLIPFDDQMWDQLQISRPNILPSPRTRALPSQDHTFLNLLSDRCLPPRRTFSADQLFSFL
eukprot:TRINITY_DN2420_c1_g1_i1.p1 TRINITY_DN2420_c1_g1~~TRINITY_DN2420_c1_g1_i1.p1  ORF type:complete len:1457 (+),score=227.19 TRINITY_DN2420_c1_g1_i1:46-4416(+)